MHEKPIFLKRNREKNFEGAGKEKVAHQKMFAFEKTVSDDCSGVTLLLFSRTCPTFAHHANQSLVETMQLFSKNPPENLLVGQLSQPLFPSNLSTQTMQNEPNLYRDRK